MRMTRMVVVAVPFLWAAGAGATTLLHVEPSELARKSELVVRGTVGRIDSHWTGDHRRIVTDVEIQVIEALKGAPAKVVVVEQPGGEVGNLGQRVEGVARFASGEEVVVFLERRGGERYLLSGMAQGKYRVERSSDGKAVFAVPEDVGDALVVDPATRQPSVARASSFEIGALRKLVKAAAKP
jgi:hypothetical protein